jgi:hypothetical protein
MKKIFFTAVILFSCFLFKSADAQVTVGVGVNIGSQPEWGPVGYSNVSYYYMPDIDAYYDVNAHQYIYLHNNAWVHVGYLPARYRNYDLYHGYKAVVNDRDPWLRNDEYRNRYASYRGRRDQEIIRNSQDARYRNHWQANANQRQYNQNARANQLDRRNRFENQRARNLNQRARQENQRGRQENQRANRQNQRANRENQRQREHN